MSLQTGTVSGEECARKATAQGKSNNEMQEVTPAFSQYWLEAPYAAVKTTVQRIAIHYRMQVHLPQPKTAVCQQHNLYYVVLHELTLRHTCSIQPQVGGKWILKAIKQHAFHTCLRLG